jgi:hypothetical protein
MFSFQSISGFLRILSACLVGQCVATLGLGAPYQSPDGYTFTDGDWAARAGAADASAA